jgi:flotillin
VADAESYATQKNAEARAGAAVAAANSDREARTSLAQAVEAEGLAERNRRIAAAEAVRAEGDAEAEAIRAKGTAEAAATLAQAEALEAGAAELLRQQVIGRLPDIVRAASEPLAAISNMTVISSDGNGVGQVGEGVASQLATATKIIKDLVGIDIAEIVTGRATGTAVGQALHAGQNGAAARGNGDGQRPTG